MSKEFSSLFKNCTLVDPANGINGRYDLAVAGAKVAEVAEDIDPARADRVFDLGGLTLLPGIIDLHVHVSSWLGGRFGHTMLAKAGVTTALDMAGPVESTLEVAAAHGVGLNIACLHYVRPGYTVKDQDPSMGELTGMISAAMDAGAFGVKILGGHYPLTPGATGRTMEVGESLGGYVAYHAGSTAKGSNIEGMAEAMEVAQGRRFHLAHINSYCRGQVAPMLEEVQRAMDLLEANPNACSESYLADINGTNAQIVDGKPLSLVTGKALEAGGYPPTGEGMAAAINDGWAQINIERPEESVVELVGGQEGLDYWQAHGTDVSVSFSVNAPAPRYVLCSARRKSGDFMVDCISTDGGGIPRNVIVPMGLAMVKLKALTMDDFARKTSLNPAAILGLPTKGRLNAGADADLTVVDPDNCTCHLSMANGELVLHEGKVVGKGTTIVTTNRGESMVRGMGLKTRIAAPFYALDRF